LEKGEYEFKITAPYKAGELESPPVGILVY